MRVLVPAVPGVSPWRAHLASAGGEDVGIDVTPVAEERWEVAFVAAPGEVGWMLEVDPDRPPPFPRVQVDPAPGVACTWRVDGALRLGYRHEPGTKPVVHPLVGPGGDWLTQLGWPPDADGRTHQHGLWVGHPDVGGANFWSDRAEAGRQMHAGFDEVHDGGASARLTALLRWEAPGGAELLAERRTIRLWALPGGESLLDLSLSLRAVGPPVTLGRAPFGLLGVRVARTFWPERGGCIRTSSGAAGEQDAQHRRARWCAYSGPTGPDRNAGIAILDHDQNPEHPTYWHVREDGWMGTAVSFAHELVIGHEPLELRYRVVAHAGVADEERLDTEHEQFCEPPLLAVTASSSDGR